MAGEATSSVEHLHPPAGPAAALATLPAPIAAWFANRFPQPTPVQRLAWPAIAAGKHLLVSAPTGSGKTLAAFLPILGPLADEPYRSSVGCLYVAPLKALISDARKNLRRVVRELDLPVQLMQRTGDTPPRIREQLQRRPPAILLTTPESLALLLTHGYASDLFAELRWVVIDEVHALAGNKRGADLALSLERLEMLSRRPPQRIGLSATCAPLSTAAGYLAGVDRACAIAATADHAPWDLAVEPVPGEEGPGFIRRVIERIEPDLKDQRTTLIFTNTRSLAERLTWSLRRRLPDWDEQIAVHHSALSGPRRRRVERWLKQGRLRVAVSSTSLELGVDIGTVDQVILIHPPGSAVRFSQRVGRSGHGPQRRRRGLVLTATPAELLEAAATMDAARSAQFEALTVPAHPLDVLCQQLVGLAAQGAFTADDAYALVRRAYPYRDLPRRDFDDCLAYLAGTAADGRSWLPARLACDGDHWNLEDDRTLRLLRRNLGTILAEETKPVCLDTAEGEALTVGQLEEPFADRLQPGDRFLLDGRCLEVQEQEGGNVIVKQASGWSPAPQWGGNGWPIARALAARLYLLRTRAAEALRDGPETLTALLADDYDLGQAASSSLADFLLRQEAVSEIPEPGSLLIEVVPGFGDADYYLHTPLHRAGNDALARLAVQRLLRDYRRSAASVVADLGMLITVGGADLTSEDWRKLLAVDNLDPDLDQAVAGSWSLRERFRCVALTSLMLLRNPAGARRRVGGREWPERRLFEKVREADPDFVLLRQAEREVFSEVLDADAAREFLQELVAQPIRIRCLAGPSPIAEHWRLIAGPAESVESPTETLERLHAELMRP